MKRILVLAMAALIALLSLVLVGCDDEKQADITTANSTTTTTQGTTENTTTTVPDTTTTTVPTTVTTTEPTTTTTKPTTTTTTKPTTMSNDELTDKMLHDSKFISYSVFNGGYGDEPTLMGDIYSEPQYKLLYSSAQVQQLLVEAKAWYSQLEDFERLYGERFRSAFDEYTEEFFEENILMLIEIPSTWQVVIDNSIEDICLNGNILNIYIYENSQGCVADTECTLYFIPVPCAIAAQVADINIDIEYEPWDGMIGKPVIYLYPESETNVCIKLGYKDKITVSYPEYVDGWSVLARPDGKLVYNETGRNLYSLYYESDLVKPFKVERDGFVVKGSEIAAFLEEKLAVLGLNEYEAEEFIIYWLPILQANEYNYIRFATAEEIESNMSLEIDPNPDTVIRVWMTFKGLDAPISVTEQQLTSPVRTGFVAVEWGGTEITR